MLNSGAALVMVLVLSDVPRRKEAAEAKMLKQVPM